MFHWNKFGGQKYDKLFSEGNNDICFGVPHSICHSRMHPFRNVFVR